MNPKVLVYGTVVVDRLRTLAAWPAVGTYGEYNSETLALGGEAANTAAALRAWGIQVTLVGNRLGNGPKAEFLREELERYGIDPAWCDPSPGPTPTCDIYLTPDGERTMLGRSWEVGPLPWPDLPPGSWFTADPNHGEASRKAVWRAAELGLSVYVQDFLDADDAVPPGSILQTSTDFVGVRGDAASNREWAFATHLRTGATVILTDGPSGASIADGGEALTIPTLADVNVVDSTGAGDRFRAGMLYQLAHGASRQEAVRWACVAGALKVQHLGAIGEIATVAEIDQRLRVSAL